MLGKMILIRTFLLHCHRCGLELSQSILNLYGHVEVGDRASLKKWSQEVGLRIEERVDHQMGFCSKCYDGRSDEDIKLINGLDVYARNVKNIENEGYRQPDSRKKHIIYQRKIREAIIQWQARTVFTPAPLLDSDTFYMEEFLTQEVLEDRLEN